MKQVLENQGKGIGRRLSRLVPVLLGLSVMLAGSPLVAAEVYKWTDENGVLHFSDTPRADGQSETIEAEEAYRPGTADVYSQPAETDANDAATEVRAEIARQREENAVAQVAIDRDCEFHRQRVVQLEPNRRVFYTDAAGEVVRMDDEERVRLVEESKAFLAANCPD